MSRKSCNKRRTIKKKRCIKKHTYNKKTFTKKQKRTHLRGGVNRIEDTYNLEDVIKKKNNNTFIFPDGIQFTGKFEDGKMNGLGTLIFPGVGEFTGKFEDGKIDRNYTENILTLKNGKILKDTDCEFSKDPDPDCIYLKPFMRD